MNGVNDPNGEAFEIRPNLDNPLVRMVDHDNELPGLIHAAMETLTSAGYEALVSDRTTNEVAHELLRASHWATSFGYDTRAAELLNLFEQLGIPETDATAHIYSEYRTTRLWFLASQLSNDRLAQEAMIVPIIEEERTKNGYAYNLPRMIRQLSVEGSVEYFKEWLHLQYGDLAKHTPDDGERADPGLAEGEPVQTPLTRLLYDLQQHIYFSRGDSVDPFVFGEYIDAIEALCAHDRSCETGIELLDTTRLVFDTDSFKELGIQQRTERMYRESLVRFLELRIPQLEDGLLAHRNVRNFLSSFVNMGWTDKRMRPQVDKLLEDLRQQGCFDEEAEAKIASWKADRRKKVRYKGSVLFTWDSDANYPRY